MRIWCTLFYATCRKWNENVRNEWTNKNYEGYKHAACICSMLCACWRLCMKLFAHPLCWWTRFIFIYGIYCISQYKHENMKTGTAYDKLTWKKISFNWTWSHWLLKWLMQLKCPQNNRTSLSHEFLKSKTLSQLTLLALFYIWAFYFCNSSGRCVQCSPYYVRSPPESTFHIVYIQPPDSFSWKMCFSTYNLLARCWSDIVQITTQLKSHSVKYIFLSFFVLFSLSLFNSVSETLEWNKWEDFVLSTTTICMLATRWGHFWTWRHLKPGKMRENWGLKDI